MSSLGARGALYATLLLALACDGKGTAPPSPSAATTATASQPPALTPQVAPAPVETPKSCRALVASGSVKAGSNPLAVQAQVENAGFIDLLPGAKLVVKHTRSGRELTLDGPARAELCRDGEEQVLLALGHFKSTAGMGARPGAEVWVATPAGLIRYGDAEIGVLADGKKVAVSVVSGDAWVEPARGSTLKGSEHLVTKGKATLSRGAATTTESLVSHCEEAAEAAASAAQRVLAGPGEKGGSDAGSSGDRAAAQVRARRAARGACASAGAALGLVTNLDEQKRQAPRIERADRLWRLVPPPKSTVPLTVSPGHR